MGKQILVRMGEEMYDDLKEASIDLDLSMAQIIRRGIQDYLQEHYGRAVRLGFLRDTE